MKNFILSILIFPFIFFLIYFLSIFFYKKKKIFKLIIITNTFFLIIFSVPIISYILEIPLYPKKNTYEKNLDKKFSLIIVPTAGFKKNENNDYYDYPSKNSIDRLYKAYVFSINKNIPIYISGGKTIKNIDSEAEILSKNFFQKIDKTKIVIENKSINTFETAINLEQYLLNKNLSKNIILFTDLYHHKRMASVLEKKKIKVFFATNSFKKKKIELNDFFPSLKSYEEINKVRYSYLAILKYIITNKVNYSTLIN